MNSRIKYALIVAGGSGSRMGKEIPKQFISIAGKPILMHTLLQFIHYSQDIRILLVLPKSQISDWEKLCLHHGFTHAIKIIEGGATRFQSVKNGLDAIPEGDALVAIHDGVRPFVSKGIIENTFLSSEKYGNGIASVPLKDSIRYVNKDINRAEDRTKFRLIQTPQTFQLTLIKKAFQIKESVDFTDDASVFEASGHAIHLVEGAYDNIKITTPEDLVIAEALFQNLRQ